MTTMAKVFVVLNLVLAGFAFGSAAALLGAQDDYKSALETTVADFEKVQENYERRKDETASQLVQQRSTASDAVAAKQVSETRATRYEGELSKAQEQNTQLISSNDKLSSELAALRLVLQNFDKALVSMTEATTAQTNLATKWQDQYRQAMGSANRMEQELANASEENQTYAAVQGDQAKVIAEQKFWLGAYGKRFGDITGRSPGAPGVVLSVKNSGDVGMFVAISVGSTDKVRIADEYHLSRGSSYVGKIDIIRVSKDGAIGRFDRKFAGGGAPPQAGDKAWVD